MLEVDYPKSVVQGVENYISWGEQVNIIEDGVS